MNRVFVNIQKFSSYERRKFNCLLYRRRFATALLLAPESGEKTREKIKKGAAEVASTAKSKLAEGLDAVEGALAKQKGM